MEQEGAGPAGGVTTIIEEMPDQVGHDGGCQVGHDGDYLGGCPIRPGMTVGVGRS